MDPVELLDHLISQTEDKIDRLKTYTITGAAQDYADYKQLVGRHDILMEQVEEYKELRERLVEA